MATLKATVIVEGATDALAGFRRAVNALLDVACGGRYRELHTADRLDYRFALDAGLPFPAFVETSTAHPDARVLVSWESLTDGVTGSATIQAGALVERDADAGMADRRQMHVVASRDGSLRLGAVLAPRAGGGWLGYVVTAHHHAFIAVVGHDLIASDGVEAYWVERWRLAGDDTQPAAMNPAEAITGDDRLALDELSSVFAERWLWFDQTEPAETAVERHRFAQYGYPVYPVNLRSEKLRRVMRAESDGLVYSSLEVTGVAVIRRVEQVWLAARV